MSLWQRWPWWPGGCATARCARQARWIAGLALWQFATGLSNVVLGWPLAAAISHTGGAAALVVVLTWALCESANAGSAVPAARLGARELSA